ncbi:DUF5133 domain-containing protein [Streptomyces sp. I05A-00742]|uniref:DUF5133 domain-containing protein n=1 Tax=Streptomyces sp. I05A-00742 TaxID=2732853 RepID=UPI001487B82D|nr:DUF5133 domain-containing protein [Streptomyces sp. I05A-00742]
MLLAHPAVLRDLVERYTALERAAAARPADPATGQGLADVTYTLCVTTGTRDVAAALRAARRRLRDTPDAAPGPDAVDAVLPRPVRPSTGRPTRRTADRTNRPAGQPAGQAAV